MARYYYTGTTTQFGVGHANLLAACKIDPAADPGDQVAILDQTTAEADGTFTLEWGADSANPTTEDWDGRICVLVLDADGAQKLKSASNDWLVGVLDDTTPIVLTYATYDPGASSSGTLTNGNLTWAPPVSDTNKYAVCNVSVTSGKWYWESTYVSGSYQVSAVFGITPTPENLAGEINALTGDPNTYSWASNGGIYNAGTLVHSATNALYELAFGDVVQFALDLDTGKLWMGKNGTWLHGGDPGAGTGELFSGVSGTFFPALQKYWYGHTVDTNFGQSAFAHTVPTGFNAGVYEETTAPAGDYEYGVFNQAWTYVSEMSISDSGLTATKNTGNSKILAFANIALLSAKYYFELKIGDAATNVNFARVGLSTHQNGNYVRDLPENGYPGVSYNQSSIYVSDGSASTTFNPPGISELVAGDTAMFAFDPISRELWIGKNGTWFNSGDPAAGTGGLSGLNTIMGRLLAADETLYPAVAAQYGNVVFQLFNGSEAAPLTYTPPAGFNAGIYREKPVFDGPLVRSTWSASEGHASITLSNNDTTASYSGGAIGFAMHGTVAPTGGKYYWETTITALNDSSIGIAAKDDQGYSSTFDNTVREGAIVQRGAMIHTAHGGGMNSAATGDSAQEAGDVLMFAFDDTVWPRRLWMGRNGTWYKGGDPAAGTGHLSNDHATITNLMKDILPLYPVISAVYSPINVTLNAGQNAFNYTVPDGFESGIFQQTDQQRFRFDDIPGSTWYWSPAGDRMEVTGSAGSNWHHCRMNNPKGGGKWYFELDVTLLAGSLGGIGIAKFDETTQTSSNAGDGTKIQYFSDGRSRVNGSYSTYGATWTAGDRVGVSIDFAANEIRGYVNGADQGVITNPNGMTDAPFVCYISGYDDNALGVVIPSKVEHLPAGFLAWG